MFPMLTMPSVLSFIAHGNALTRITFTLLNRDARARNHGTPKYGVLPVQSGEPLLESIAAPIVRSMITSTIHYADSGGRRLCANEEACLAARAAASAGGRFDKRLNT
jgi:hypothetical protein